MKKITFLFAILGTAFSMQAQTFFAESNSPSPYNSSYSTQAVIWSQPPVTDGDGQTGAVSTHSTPDDQGVYSSDDFNLTESSRIDKITLFGFQLERNLEDLITGFDIFIYTNSGDNTPSGNPSQVGTGVVELPNISTLQTAPIAVEFIFDNDEGNYTFIVDMTLANGGDEVVLPAGDYWLVANPRLNITPPSDFVLRWNWYDGGSDNGVNEAHVIDPDDTVGVGITDWTPLTEIGAPFVSTAFIIEGEPFLGVNDAISEIASVYPNPTNDILNVDMPSDVTLKSSSLFNVLGQDTGVKLVNGIMNIYNLANGVYILKLETSAGTLTQNVIKN